MFALVDIAALKIELPVVICVPKFALLASRPGSKSAEDAGIVLFTIVEVTNVPD